MINVGMIGRFDNLYYFSDNDLYLNSHMSSFVFPFIEGAFRQRRQFKPCL